MDNGKTPKEALKKDRPLSPMERIIALAMGENREFGAEDDPGKEKYPALWEFMSKVYVGRDKLRQPSAVRIALGPGGVLIQLTDYSMAQALDVTCPALDGIWEALEKELNNPRAAWRPWGKKEPQLRKRKSGN